MLNTSPLSPEAGSGLVLEMRCRSKPFITHLSASGTSTWDAAWRLVQPPNSTVRTEHRTGRHLRCSSLTQSFHPCKGLMSFPAVNDNPSSLHGHGAQSMERGVCRSKLEARGWELGFWRSGGADRQPLLPSAPPGRQLTMDDAAGPTTDLRITQSAARQTASLRYRRMPPMGAASD